MQIRVIHEEVDRFRVTVGTHELVVDQPDTGDAGPTPTDLFVASLAACVAFYAGRFLDRHAIATEGLAVECSFEMAEDRPARVASIDVRVVLPAGFPDSLSERLQAVVDHCTVHNSLAIPPTVRIGLEAPSSVVYGESLSTNHAPGSSSRLV